LLTFVRRIIEETGKMDAWQNQTSLQNFAWKSTYWPKSPTLEIDTRSVNPSA